MSDQQLEGMLNRPAPEAWWIPRIHWMTLAIVFFAVGAVAMRSLTTWGQAGSEFAFGWPLFFLYGEIPLEYTVPAEPPPSLLILALEKAHVQWGRLTANILTWVVVITGCGYSTERLIRQLRCPPRMSLKLLFVVLAVAATRLADVVSAAPEDPHQLWPYGSPLTYSIVKDVHAFAFVCVALSWGAVADWASAGIRLVVSPHIKVHPSISKQKRGRGWEQVKRTLNPGQTKDLR